MQIFRFFCTADSISILWTPRADVANISKLVLVTRNIQVINIEPRVFEFKTNLHAPNFNLCAQIVPFVCLRIGFCHRKIFSTIIVRHNIHLNVSKAHLLWQFVFIFYTYFRHKITHTLYLIFVTIIHIYFLQFSFEVPYF